MVKLIKADSAAIVWDPDKKTWRVRIQAGEEIIKRPVGAKLRRDAAEDALRTAALETVHAEGYEVDPSAVTIAR